MSDDFIERSVFIQQRLDPIGCLLVDSVLDQIHGHGGIFRIESTLIERGEDQLAAMFDAGCLPYEWLSTPS